MSWFACLRAAQPRERGHPHHAALALLLWISVKRSLMCAVLAACSSDETPDDRVEAATSVQIVPGLGDRVLLTLQPWTSTRLASEDPPYYAEYLHKIVGPTLGVDLDGTRRATFARGTSELVIGATRAWLVQSDRTTRDTRYAPVEYPTSFVTAATIDRATLDVVATTTFSPPIVFPVAIGDNLLDVGVDANEALVRLRNPDGSATELYRAPAASRSGVLCANGNGVILGSPNKVVSARRDPSGAWMTHEVMLPVSVFYTNAMIACDAMANRVAVHASDGVMVFDIHTEQTVLHVPGAKSPFALRSDGAAIVALRSTDNILQFTDASGTRELAFTTPPLPMVVMSGDLAYFQGISELAVIDLTDGTLTTHPAVPGNFADVKGWTGGFVIASSRYEQFPAGVNMLVQLLVIDADGATELAMPRAVRSPKILSVAGTRLYLSALNHENEPRLFLYDLSTRQLVDEVAQPQCDEENILAERGC